MTDRPTTEQPTDQQTSQQTEVHWEAAVLVMCEGKPKDAFMHALLH